MSWTLTTSQAILYKAGANVSTTASTSGAILQKISDQAEAVVVAKSRYDWVTNYASVISSFKPILDDAVSSYGAILLIEYDMSGYTSNGEAVTMVNILRDTFERNMAILREKETQDFAVNV